MSFTGRPFEDTSDRSSWARSVEGRLGKVIARVTSQDIVDRAVTAAKIALGTVTLGHLASEAWTDYTPTLTGGTTNPTLGTGSATFGRYVRIGRTVIGMARFKFGTSGTNAGSGEYRISLPLTAAIPTDSGALSAVLGTGFLFDSDASDLTTVTFVQAGVATYGIIAYTTTSFTFVDHDSPWAWAASDQITVHFAYEAAG